MPTRPFFEQYYYTRPWVTEQPSEETWLYYEADIKRVRTQVERCNGTFIETAGHTSPEDVAATLAVQFGLR